MPDMKQATTTDPAGTEKHNRWCPLLLLHKLGLSSEYAGRRCFEKVY
jgi:hypothetical protein